MAVNLPMFEELDRSFVFLRRFSALERAEVPPSPTLRIDLPRVKSIFARFQLPNHADFQSGPTRRNHSPCAEYIPRPPFVLFVDLHELREQVHRSSITPFVDELRGFLHFLDDDEQITICLLHHLTTSTQWVRRTADSHRNRSTPQTVLCVTEDHEPGRPSRVWRRPVPNGENAPHHILGDGNSEGQGDRLSVRQQRSFARPDRRACRAPQECRSRDCSGSWIRNRQFHRRRVFSSELHLETSAASNGCESRIGQPLRS